VVSCLVTSCCIMKEYLTRIGEIVEEISLPEHIIEKYEEIRREYETIKRSISEFPIEDEMKKELLKHISSLAPNWNFENRDVNGLFVDLSELGAILASKPFEIRQVVKADSVKELVKALNMYKNSIDKLRKDVVRFGKVKYLTFSASPDTEYGILPENTEE